MCALLTGIIICFAAECRRGVKCAANSIQEMCEKANNGRKWPTITKRHKQNREKMKSFQNRGCEPSIPGHPRGRLFASPMYTRIQIDAPSLYLDVKLHRHGTQTASG